MIQVGRVTQRKHAKLHLGGPDNNCPVLQRRPIIAPTAQPLTVDNAPLICGHCRPRVLAAAKDAQITANMRAGHSTTPNGAHYAHVAGLLVEALESPTDRLTRKRNDDAFRATFNAIVAASLTDLVPAA